MSSITRRHLLAAAALAQSAASAQAKSWTPKLGILANFSESNVRYAKEQGYSSIGLFAHTKTTLDLTTPLTTQRIEQVKRSVQASGLHLSVIGCHQPNHIAVDAAERARANEYFVRAIELAGALGVRHVGTVSGKITGAPLNKQVEEIVRVYSEKYFPLCQKHNVRILWEQWVGGPNIATGPIGFEALFKAFGNSPHIGLQFDPSHLVMQMIDPIQAARDWVDKIYDVHLKDTEIRWPVLRRIGINPLNNERWWRFRIPGSGEIDWKAFFTVLQDAGFTGAMNIEHEDALYYPAYEGEDFSASFKNGFQVAHRFLSQYVPG